MGPVVGAIVMMTGIAVLGVVTANVSSAFVAGLSDPSRTSEPDVATLQAQVARLTAEFAAVRAGAPGATAGRTPTGDYPAGDRSGEGSRGRAEHD
jgi:predicted trehalose synthase